MAIPNASNRENPIRLIGCCGAYCKTCKAFAEGFCKGCKLGYDKGGRDIEKAKCHMKLCCLKEKKLETCADCPEYPKCKTIQGFFSKKGHKYTKYRQSVEFIRTNGYPKFITSANKWKGAYGKIG